MEKNKYFSWFKMFKMIGWWALSFLALFVMLFSVYKLSLVFDLKEYMPKIFEDNAWNEISKFFTCFEKWVNSIWECIKTRRFVECINHIWEPIITSWFGKWVKTSVYVLAILVFIFATIKFLTFIISCFVLYFRLCVGALYLIWRFLSSEIWRFLSWVSCVIWRFLSSFFRRVYEKDWIQKNWSGFVCCVCKIWAILAYGVRKIWAILAYGVCTIWEIFAWFLRIVNIAFFYVLNKHLSILFGAMLAVVVCVAASMKIPKLHDCIQSDMPDNAFPEKASKPGHYKSEEKSEVTKDRKEIKFSYLMMWAVDRMFSYDKARKDMSRWNRDKSGEKWIAVIAFGLFLFTWFVGGGVLVSALIATTIDIWSGKWRVWGILLRNHTVILGWDETVPVLLKEHIQSRKWLCFCRPETIVIMTESPAHKVRAALRDVLHESILKKLLRRPLAMVSTVVCNGKFDDADEIRDLCLQRANSIYVVGEMDDPSHDVRVLMAPKKIQKYSDSLLQREYFQFDERRLNCHLNIKSLHLFWQHIHGRAKIGDNKVCLRPLNIVPHNFYDSWVKRLFSKVPDGKKHDNETHFAFRTGCSGDVHIVIVGFGAFGQALAVEAAAVAHYGKGRRTYITVIDDDIGEKVREFRALFPRIDEIVDVYLSFVADVKVGSEKFRCMLEDFAENARKKEDVKDNSQQLTVALTMERDEDNLKMVLPIYKAINGDAGNVQLIVAQKSCETDLNSSEETFLGMYGCKNVRFFGFRNGVGFDVWRSERIARELYVEREMNKKKVARELNENEAAKLRKCKRSKWYELNECERQYYRMIVNGLEELCYVNNSNTTEDTVEKSIKQISDAAEILINSEEAGGDAIDQEKGLERTKDYLKSIVIKRAGSKKEVKKDKERS